MSDEFAKEFIAHFFVIKNLQPQAKSRLEVCEISHNYCFNSFVAKSDPSSSRVIREYFARRLEACGWL